MDKKNCRLDFLENCQVQPSPSLGPKNNLNFFTLFYVLPFIPSIRDRVHRNENFVEINPV